MFPTMFNSLKLFKYTCYVLSVVCKSSSLLSCSGPTVFLASCSRTTNLLIQDSSFVERLSRIYSYISELILLNISIIISLLLTECLFLYNFLRFHMLFAILIHGIWSVTLIKITPIKETNDIYRHQDCCHKSIPYQPY